MRFGLDENTIKDINSVFSKYSEITKVVLYGSRAKGSEKNGSDIDLCIMDDIDIKLLYRLEDDLDELMLPYKVDLTIFAKLNNNEIKEHIKRVGKEFY